MYSKQMNFTGMKGANRNSSTTMFPQPIPPKKRSINKEQRWKEATLQQSFLLVSSIPPSPEDINTKPLNFYVNDFAGSGKASAVLAC